MDGSATVESTCPAVRPSTHVVMTPTDQRSKLPGPPSVVGAHEVVPPCGPWPGLPLCPPPSPGPAQAAPPFPPPARPLAVVPVASCRTQVPPPPPRPSPPRPGHPLHTKNARASCQARSSITARGWALAQPLPHPACPPPGPGPAQAVLPPTHTHPPPACPQATALAPWRPQLCQ